MWVGYDSSVAGSEMRGVLRLYNKRGRVHYEMATTLAVGKSPTVQDEWHVCVGDMGRSQRRGPGIGTAFSNLR